MNVLLCPIGSRGDVQPMLVLGSELERRGHAVRIAAPPNFRLAAEALGLPFVPIGEDIHRVIMDNRALSEQHPVRALPELIRLLRRKTEQQVRELFEGVTQADLVVAAGLSFGPRLLAEKLGVPYCFVCYSLSAVPSAAHPPAPLPIFGLPRLGNRALWLAVTRLFDGAVGPVLSRLRREFGLQPDRTPWRTIHVDSAVLAQDRVLGELPADAPPGMQHVAALVPEKAQAEPLPDAVERFLLRARESARSIVYLGFGSMPSVERARIAAAAAHIAERHAARVLLFSQHDEDRELALPEAVLPIGPVAHQLLFPQVDLIVHHGGAGTTAAALRAGVPQLIVPHIVDQFFHGRRLAELGLAPAPVPKSKFDAAALERAVVSLERFRAPALAITARIEAAGGARQAADHLEMLAQRR
jgi:UDP:flavonoid glycosyltransferase YjiC (YdhE family)